MIRVNLLKNKVGDPTGMGRGVPEDDSGSELRDSIVKVAFMLLFVVGLMIYEGQNIRALNDQANRLQMQINDLEGQATAKAAEAEGVKDVEKQARELEDKLKVLKLLSKLRLREVKTLDFMQSSIPEKVWLKNIVFESEGQAAKGGSYRFTGMSVATEDLSEFVKRLEESAYLNEVIVIKNQEVTPNGRTMTARDFMFTAEIEGVRQ